MPLDIYSVLSGKTMIAILKKQIQFGTVIFDVGEQGEVVDRKKYVELSDFYDLYVKFPNRSPVGVFSDEVEVRDGQR